MSDDYKSPGFDEYAHYVAKARELRARFWRNVFITMFSGTASVAGKVAATADRMPANKRVTS